MKLGVFLGVVGAVMVHLGVITFGGVLLHAGQKDQGTLQQVDLLSEADTKEKEKDKPEVPVEKAEEIDADTEEPPDAAEILRNLEVTEVNAAPQLEAASLSAIEAALNGQAGGNGDFAQSLDFASGGRIGGTGKAGGVDEKLDSAFSLAEIDQKPRAVFQAAPLYPADMRSQKLEGVVTVLFIVDATGRVTDPRIEKSTNPAFEKPALDAVKQWKFEPAVKAGERVKCKMRVPIRFQTNG